MRLLKNLTIGFVVTLLFLVGQTVAQEKPAKIKKVNFGYSKNPPTKKAEVDKKKAETKKDSEKPAKTSTDKKEDVAKNVKKDESTDSKKEKKVENKESVDSKKEDKTENSENANSIKEKAENKENAVNNSNTTEKKTETKKKLLPTEIYKVGVNDVLLISLQNTSANSTKYYTVLSDGTIDYPLAGEMILVKGLTVDEIEDVLKEKVKLYKNPQISVKVREYSSHKIEVLGLVEKPGEKFLQREALPLFVVRAEAIVKPNATKIIIKRKSGESETFSIAEAKEKEILVFSGDTVEFAGTEIKAKVPNRAGYFYIGSFVKNSGRGDFYEGITLMQAIYASGGLKNLKLKKVIIRSKNEKGLLVSKTYNLKSIEKGKIPDPSLKVGDIIEEAGKK